MNGNKLAIEIYFYEVHYINLFYGDQNDFTDKSHSQLKFKIFKKTTACAPQMNFF